MYAVRQHNMYGIINPHAPINTMNIRQGNIPNTINELQKLNYQINIEMDLKNKHPSHRKYTRQREKGIWIWSAMNMGVVYAPKPGVYSSQLKCQYRTTFFVC